MRLRPSTPERATAFCPFFVLKLGRGLSWVALFRGKWWAFSAILYPYRYPI